MSDLVLLDRVNALRKADDRLIAQGRLVRVKMLVEAGDQAAVVTIADGAVTVIANANELVMPAWTFALRASAREWAEFWQPAPRPGHHDLFALLRRKQLRLEGDIHPFMSNLFYFKALLALPRVV
ncbi:MAG TPA: hypothetical protein VGM12_33425 [Trebonia sp.]